VKKENLCCPNLSFTKIIRTRIVSEARTIQDQTFDSVAQLTKYLEQIYSPSKNVYQLQGELGELVAFIKKNEEDIRYLCKSSKILINRKTNIRSM